MSETTLISPELRVLADRAQELGKLKDHPSWQALRDELERVTGNYIGRLSRKLVSGGQYADPIDQREIDYQRGFFSGAKWILDNPEQAEQTLEAALRKAALKRSSE